MALSTVLADPFFTEMERTMNRAMAPFFKGLPSLATTGNMQLSDLHPMDVVEHPDRYSIVADAPGMTPDDIKVELQGDRLTVSGEKCISKETKDEKQGYRVHRQERSFTRFSRSFVLPDNAKPDAISARMDNGVLSVDIPKETKEAPKAEVKRIRVDGSKL